MQLAPPKQTWHSTLFWRTSCARNLNLSSKGSNLYVAGFFLAMQPSLLHHNQWTIPLPCYWRMFKMVTMSAFHSIAIKQNNNKSTSMHRLRMSSYWRRTTPKIHTGSIKTQSTIGILHFSLDFFRDPNAHLHGCYEHQSLKQCELTTRL